jgi:hypothetical protein
VGSYWDRKGLHEIDVIALDDLESKAIVAEVKRNPMKISRAKLQANAQVIETELVPYETSYKGYSLHDM